MSSAVGLGVDLLQVLQRHRVADARDDVLALRVLEVVAVHALLAAAGVTGEGDAGARVRAQVAEHHRHDVDRGAEVGRNPLLAPVQDGPVGVPGVEDRLDRHVHLLARILREVPAGLVLDDRLEGLHQACRSSASRSRSFFVPLACLAASMADSNSCALDVQHGLAEHLDQAPVGVPREPLAAGLLGQAVHRLIGQADVEHRLHHAGHGELGAGPDADQQRVRVVAELAAHAAARAPAGAR